MKNNKLNAVICDIDGVLADDSHRLPLLEDKNWEQYFNALQQDTPMNNVGTTVLSALVEKGSFPVFITGRPDTHREDTMVWLNTHFPHLLKD